tara:strand:+ start:462 stop:782 length:321 start_codon:yes stop_codon:yes gene_type:complete
MDFFQCDSAKLNDIEFVEIELIRAATHAGANILGKQFHRFSPHGVTGILSLQESHLSIHTWPEHEFAAADFFSCGDIKAEIAYEILSNALVATERNIKIIHRGESD